MARPAGAQVRPLRPGKARDSLAQRPRAGRQADLGQLGGGSDCGPEQGGVICRLGFAALGLA
jgi:hypothetical protein